MALITGGKSTLGLMISRERIANGTEHLIAVSRTGRQSAGQLETFLIDAIQDVARHESILCDISDGAACTDMMHFAYRIPTGMDRMMMADVTWGEGLGEIPVHSMDTASLELLSSYVDSLTSVKDQLGWKALPNAQKPLEVRAKMARVLSRAREQVKGVAGREDILFVEQFEAKLAELDKLIGSLQKERPSGTAAELAETAEGTGRLSCQYDAHKVEHSNAKLSDELLLNAMEKEFNTVRTSTVECHSKPKPQDKQSKCFTDVAGKAQQGAQDEVQQLRRLTAEAEVRAKQAADRKAKLESESKARKEAERKAKAEAERKAATEAKAREMMERNSREEQALRRAQAEAGRRLVERVAQRHAQQESGQELMKEAEPTIPRAECPSGHALEPFTVGKGFPCDMCEEDAADGDTMWGCRANSMRGFRACAYDVCNQCKDTMIRHQPGK